MFLSDESVELIAHCLPLGLTLGYSDDEDEPRSRAFSTPEPEVTPDGPEGPEATSPSTDTSEESKSESAVEKTAKDRGLGTEVRLGFILVFLCSICGSWKNWGFPNLYPVMLHKLIVSH